MSHELYPILLTIDVEDRFQGENFKEWIPLSSWPSYELRVEKNTRCILNLLDSQGSALSTQGSRVSKVGKDRLAPDPEKRIPDIGHSCPVESVSYSIGELSDDSTRAPNPEP